MKRAFEDVTDEPCPVCVDLAKGDKIQSRAVMPLPKFPARLRQDGRKCCKDCQATETMMAIGVQHPDFAAARLTVANDRIEGTLMPLGMMEHFGLCKYGHIAPSSMGDLDGHIDWLEKHDLRNDASVVCYEEEDD